MRLRVVSVCQDVGVHVPFFLMLFYVVAKSGSEDTIVAFHLIIALWVVCHGKKVLDLHDHADMLKEPWLKLLPVTKL